MSNDLLSTIFNNDIKLMAVYHRAVHQAMGHPSHHPVQMNTPMVGLYGNVAMASMPDFYPATIAPLIGNFS
jgi:hypothetical protein